MDGGAAEPSRREPLSPDLVASSSCCVRAVFCWSVSARGVWERDDSLNIGEPVRHRLLKQVDVIKRYPEESAAALAGEQQQRCDERAEGRREIDWAVG